MVKRPKPASRCVFGDCRRRVRGDDGRCEFHTISAWVRHTRNTKRWPEREPLLLPDGQQRPRDLERERAMWAAQEARLRAWANEQDMDVYTRERWINDRRTLFKHNLDKAYENGV